MEKVNEKRDEEGGEKGRRKIKTAKIKDKAHFYGSNSDLIGLAAIG